jgi:hypothetical protein
MTYHSLVYCGAGLVTLGLIALYLLMLCMIYAYVHVCLDEGEYTVAWLCAGLLMLLGGVGILISGLLLS